MNIVKIKFKEFSEKYITTPRRKYLFDKFIEELKIIRSNCKNYRIIIFGSFITDKAEPNDIDIIISLIPRDDKILKMTVNGLEQVNEEEVEIHYCQSVFFLKTTSKLINRFNEIPMNKRMGIKITRAVELLDL